MATDCEGSGCDGRGEGTVWICIALGYPFLALGCKWQAEDEAFTDNSKKASQLVKDLLAITHGKKIFENCDRQKEQAAATQIASSADVRCWKNACRGI